MNISGEHTHTYNRKKCFNFDTFDDFDTFCMNLSIFIGKNRMYVFKRSSIFAIHKGIFSIEFSFVDTFWINEYQKLHDVVYFTAHTSAAHLHTYTLH